VERLCKEYGLSLNAKKTQTVVKHKGEKIDKRRYKKVNIKINGERIKGVHEYVHLEHIGLDTLSACLMSVYLNNCSMRNFAKESALSVAKRKGLKTL
jgi:hypothetical protein